MPEGPCKSIATKRRYLYTYGDDSDESQTARRYSIVSQNDDFYFVNCKVYESWRVDSIEVDDSTEWESQSHYVPTERGDIVRISRKEIDTKGFFYCRESKEIYYSELPTNWQIATSGKVLTGVGFLGGPFDGRQVKLHHCTSGITTIPVGDERHAVYALTATGRFRYVVTQLAELLAPAQSAILNWLQDFHSDDESEG